MLTVNYLKSYLLNIHRFLIAIEIEIRQSYYYKLSSTIVSMVTICVTNESKHKVTTSNVVFPSVKFASTIDAIQKNMIKTYELI